MLMVLTLEGKFSIFTYHCYHQLFLNPNSVNGRYLIQKLGYFQTPPRTQQRHGLSYDYHPTHDIQLPGTACPDVHFIR